MVRSPRIVSLLAALGVAVSIPLAPAALADDADIALYELKGRLAEAPGPFAWLEGNESFSTLESLITSLDAMTANDTYEGVVIRLKGTAITLTQIEEIGQAIDRVQASGKKVFLFADNYANAELILGSFADETIVQQGGSVSLTGIHAQEMFLADTLAWLGIKADLVQIGKYKGANEQFTQSTPTKPWEENFNQLLDSLYANRMSILSTNLGLSNDQLEAAMGEVWFANADDAVKAGLIDTQLDLPLLEDHLAEVFNEDITWHPISPENAQGFDVSNPFALWQMILNPPSHKPVRNTIAVLHVVGTIVDGESKAGGLMGGESVGSATIRRALEDILDEDLIKGVVVRIDSPGGSAIASEVMWQGLRRVAETKPVWASVGSMAASGGYYTAVGCDTIYVNPSSIVGSIGVVGGKFTFGGLYDKLHINIVSHDRGPNAGLFSTVEPWNDEQRAFVAAKMTETYNLFTSRVEAGRTGIDLSNTAEGRLFTGNQAIEMKMADKVGSLDDTIKDMADQLGLENYAVMSYPGPKSLDDLLKETFGNFLSAPIDSNESAHLALLKQVLGPANIAQLANAGRALLGFQTQPVQTIMPRVLILE